MIVVATPLSAMLRPITPGSGAKSFAPEVLRNQADIIPHFFLLKKIAAKNRMNAQQIEIICGDVLAQHLCWFAKSGQDVTVAPIGGYTRKTVCPSR